jgi:hypothetical protein
LTIGDDLDRILEKLKIISLLPIYKGGEGLRRTKR